MKINMAETDCFNIGMSIACVTCHGQKIEGEVIAFDHQTKILCLKSPASNQKPELNDVRLINMNLVGDVKVLKEASASVPPLTDLNLQKLSERLRTNRNKKLEEVDYIGIGVTSEAQELFHYIRKTLNDVRWEKDEIIVLNTVIIKPPYKVSNIHTKDGRDTNQAVQHVSKIVEKYYRESSSKDQSKESTERD